MNPSQVIDRIELEKETGCVVLTVVDDLGWADENAHIQELQEKLNAYLASVESGDVYKLARAEVGHDVPRSSPIRITILATQPLSAQGKAFFEYARDAFSEAKVGLVFQQIVH